MYLFIEVYLCVLLNSILNLELNACINQGVLSLNRRMYSSLPTCESSYSNKEKHNKALFSLWKENWTGY